MAENVAPDLSFIPKAYGPLLVGGLFAFAFSGMVTVQCVVYFKLYPEDSYFKKTMVATVWFLDLVHSALVCGVLWFYFIHFYGQPEQLHRIPLSIPLSFFVTGMQTLTTHSFFAHKIHRSGGSNWWISSPIIVLILARLSVVTFATSEMAIHKDFEVFFKGEFGWTFTVGLSLSAGLDVVIAGCLFYFLRRIRKRMGSPMMVTVVDSLTRYTMERGFLTCLMTIAVLVTWLALSDTLISLGLHFTIAKLYINSLLASLNTRKELREIRDLTEEGSQPPPSVFSPADFASIRPRHPAAIVNPIDVHLSSRRRPKIEINVHKRVEHNSNSLGTLSAMMYPKTAPMARPTILEWRSGSYHSTTSLNSTQTDLNEAR